MGRRASFVFVEGKGSKLDEHRLEVIRMVEIAYQVSINISLVDIVEIMFILISIRNTNRPNL